MLIEEVNKIVTSTVSVDVTLLTLPLFFREVPVDTDRFALLIDLNRLSLSL